MHEHHHRWTLHGFPNGKKPSDVFREHIITCFIDDAAGVRNRDLIGIDNITWECDYPHSDSTWPSAPEILWKLARRRARRGHPQDDLAQHDAALLSTTPSSTSRRSSARSARCARRRRTSTSRRASAAGGKEPSDYAKGYATMGDIIKQMAGAFSTPFENKAK